MRRFLSRNFKGQESIDATKSSDKTPPTKYTLPCKVIPQKCRKDKYVPRQKETEFITRPALPEMLRGIQAEMKRHSSLTSGAGNSGQPLVKE